uniref:Uncharacterized protein n=1 Tax=Anopheles farauti TaxID=69004 RepID=A0A182Q9T0_9DIPT
MLCVRSSTGAEAVQIDAVAERVAVVGGLMRWHVRCRHVALHVMMRMMVMVVVLLLLLHVSIVVIRRRRFLVCAGSVAGWLRRNHRMMPGRHFIPSTTLTSKLHGQYTKLFGHYLLQTVYANVHSPLPLGLPAEPAFERIWTEPLLFSTLSVLDCRCGTGGGMPRGGIGGLSASPNTSGAGPGEVVGEGKLKLVCGVWKLPLLPEPDLALFSEVRESRRWLSGDEVRELIDDAASLRSGVGDCAELIDFISACVQDVHRCGGRLLHREVFRILEEAQQLTAQHGVERFPRAYRGLLAARLQLVLALQHSLHLDRRQQRGVRFGRRRPRGALILAEALRPAAGREGGRPLDRLDAHLHAFRPLDVAVRTAAQTFLQHRCERVRFLYRARLVGAGDGAGAGGGVVHRRVAAATHGGRVHGGGIVTIGRERCSGRNRTQPIVVAIDGGRFAASPFLRDALYLLLLQCLVTFALDALLLRHAGRLFRFELLLELLLQQRDSLQREHLLLLRGDRLLEVFVLPEQILHLWDRIAQLRFLQLHLAADDPALHVFRLLQEPLRVEVQLVHLRPLHDRVVQQPLTLLQHGDLLLHLVREEVFLQDQLAAGAVEHLERFLPRVHLRPVLLDLADQRFRTGDILRQIGCGDLRQHLVDPRHQIAVLVEVRLQLFGLGELPLPLDGAFLQLRPDLDRFVALHLDVFLRVGSSDSTDVIFSLIQAIVSSAVRSKTCTCRAPASASCRATTRSFSSSHSCFVSSRFAFITSLLGFPSASNDSPFATHAVTRDSFAFRFDTNDSNCAVSCSTCSTSVPYSSEPAVVICSSIHSCRSSTSRTNSYSFIIAASFFSRSAASRFNSWNWYWILSFLLLIFSLSKCARSCNPLASFSIFSTVARNAPSSRWSASSFFCSEPTESSSLP